MIAWIRILFWIIVFLATWGLLRRKIGKKRNFCMGLALAVILLGTVTALIPMEHTIWRFDSPERAFAFKNRGKVVLTLEGEESAYVLAEDGKDSCRYDYVAKKDDKWCAVSGMTKRPVMIVNDTAAVLVYRFRNTEDYYIEVWSHDNEEVTVSDNRGTVFHKIGKSYAIEDITVSDYTYYGYVRHIDASYQIKVGEEIVDVIQ